MWWRENSWGWLELGPLFVPKPTSSKTSDRQVKNSLPLYYKRLRRAHVIIVVVATVVTVDSSSSGSFRAILHSL